MAAIVLGSFRMSGMVYRGHYTSQLQKQPTEDVGGISGWNVEYGRIVNRRSGSLNAICNIA